MGYLIVGIIVIIFILWAFWAQVRARFFIVERNQDIIQKCLGEIYAGDRSDYVEYKVRDCIIKIAQKEGHSDLAPKWGEWLSKWQARSGIPKEYVELKDYIEDLFSKKHEELVAEQVESVERKKAEEKKREQEQKKREQEEKREQEKREAIAKSRQKILDRNKDLVDKFLEIAERKVSIIDDYGDENWEVLPKEVSACLKKISQREGKVDIDFECQPWLRNELEDIFREYHEKQKSKSARSANVNGLSGVEFETWIAKLLKENGFDDVRGTSATGDQGADLIVKKDGKTIIIQAKRCQSVVSNKAVQEVISAISYYNGDEGWVVTNSTFTPSAKALAHKSNIKLIDGKILDNLENFLKSNFIRVKG